MASLLAGGESERASEPKLSLELPDLKPPNVGADFVGMFSLERVSRIFARSCWFTSDNLMKVYSRLMKVFNNCTHSKDIERHAHPLSPYKNKPNDNPQYLHRKHHGNPLKTL